MAHRGRVEELLKLKCKETFEQFYQFFVITFLLHFELIINWKVFDWHCGLIILRLHYDIDEVSSL